MPIEIHHLPGLRLAYLRHTGPYSHPGLPQTWERLASWCERHGRMCPRPKFYGLSLDDPQSTPPEHCRYDACVPVEADFVAADGIAVQDFPGGRYARVHFSGPAHEIGAAWARLYCELLPAAGLAPDARPAVEVYDEDCAMDPDTGAFACWLCAPLCAETASLSRAST